MGKWRARLLIALAIPASVVAGLLLGRNVWNATTTPAGSAAPGSATHEPAMSSVCGTDTSGHRVSFITVEPGVQLEVLDWGGTGETLVLLAGLGDNAHVFDQFAYQLMVGSQIWTLDRQAALSAGRQGFAVWLYEQFLPAVWERWLVHNCKFFSCFPPLDPHAPTEPRGGRRVGCRLGRPRRAGHVLENGDLRDGIGDLAVEGHPDGLGEGDGAPLDELVVVRG